MPFKTSALREFSVTGSSASATDAFSVFYAVKPASYFSNARADFVDRLPRDGTAEILEIGCGNGATGALAPSSYRKFWNIWSNPARR